MKFVHLADLHIGKRINGFSMLDDQKYILEQIIHTVDTDKPDAVFIAGDVYDAPLPPVEAVRLFDEFLTRLSALGVSIFIISGNHDSADRLAFGTNLLVKSRVYICTALTGEFMPVKLTDQYGTVNVYMLPFLKPIHARKIWPDEDIQTYEDAVRTAVKNMNINKQERNIIIAHQFITGAKTSDSEEINVGGLDNISADVFSAFDYAALGHIHRPQKIGCDTVRYAGTPLKYSFSECGHKKMLTVVELNEKNNIEIELKPLQPLHDMREIRGNYNDLVLKDNYTGTAVDDYIAVTLTDEEEIPDAVSRLRTVYPNIMKLTYDNTRTQTNNIISADDTVLNVMPIDLLKDFYMLQNNKQFTDRQRDFADALIKKIWGME